MWGTITLVRLAGVVYYEIASVLKMCNRIAREIQNFQKTYAHYSPLDQQTLKQKSNGDNTSAFSDNSEYLTRQTNVYLCTSNSTGMSNKLN